MCSCPLVGGFYTKIHDGLVDHIVGALAGLYQSLRLIDWRFWLSESVLEYVSDPSANPPLPGNLIMFHTDGAGGYTCINKGQAGRRRMDRNRDVAAPCAGAYTGKHW